MKVLSFGNPPAVLPGGPDGDRLLAALKAGGMTVQFSGEGAAVGRDPAPDIELADLRYVPGDGLGAFVRSLPSRTSLLVSPDSFLKSSLIEDLLRALRAHPHRLFIAFPAPYDPVLLELKRYIRLGSLGKLLSGEFRAVVSVPAGTVEAGLLGGIDLVSHLFGLPVEVREPASGSFPSGPAVRALTLSSGTGVRADLSVRTGEADGVSGTCSLSFSGGALSVKFGTADSGFLFAPTGGTPWTAFAAEGDGEYYLALDLRESLEGKRESGILDPGWFFASRRSGLSMLSGPNTERGPS